MFWKKKQEEKQPFNLLRNIYSTVIANNIYWDETCINSIESTEKMCFENMTGVELIAMVDYLYWLETGEPEMPIAKFFDLIEKIKRDKEIKYE